MRDLIDRQAAIDVVHEEFDDCLVWDESGKRTADEFETIINRLPSVQPGFDEWCTDCKEYDQENHCCPRWNRVIREALKDAQPEERTNERTETHACDLIDRQAAIDAHYEYCNKHPDAGFPVWSLKILEDLPSAQPEVLACGEGELIAQPEIIRCNDCKHWTQTTGNMRGFGLGDCDYINAKLVNCNGFCYWAERRTDEE